MKSLISLALSFILLCSCTTETREVQQEPAAPHWEQQGQSDLNNYFVDRIQLRNELSDEDWLKMQWVSKTLRVLRGGKGLQSNEDIEPYLERSKEEIVDDLLTKPEFIDTIFLFNLEFLGFSKDRLKDAFGNWDMTLFEQQAALTSALEFAQGGDYLSLFNFYPKTVLQPLFPPFIGDNTDLQNLTDPEKREYLYQNVLTKLEEAKQAAKDQEVFDFIKLCENYRSEDWGLAATGFSKGFFFENNYMTIESFSLCFAPPASHPDRDAFLSAMDQLKERIDKLMDVIRKVQDNTYEKLADFEFSDLRSVNSNYKEDYFNFTMSQALQNSSTNFNRKRAAYMLDRFLCDDLVPIDVELPDNNHGQGAHGSEPSCYACHYRLDPMAGFFKDRGIFFFDFAGNNEIIFDDQARMDKAEYDKNWKNPEGSVREWNIGVVRSEKDEQANHYGENLQDLFQILKKMPEVKQCLTRRVFEYVTHKKQNVDRGYIEESYKKFDTLAQQNSSEAIKYLFKSFVLSNTFSHPDPEIKECYDFPANFDPRGVPPCEVRFILDSKCASCHFPFGGEKGLDLLSWVEFEDGFGFIHTPEGEQLPVKETFKRMKEALSTPDPKKRMPLDQHMDPVDRETLFLWVEEQMGE